MQAEKDKKTKANLRIGVDFLEKSLLEFQVKLFEVEERHEARYVEFCAGEALKGHAWPSTAVKAGHISAVDIENYACHSYLCCASHSSLYCSFWRQKEMLLVHDKLVLCASHAGGAGKEPTEIGRMENGKRCGDCVMVDFYKQGSLKKNGVVISEDRRNNSTSYPVLIAQETAMQLLD